MTDGTEAGTTRVYRAPGEDARITISGLTALGDRLIFSAPTSASANGIGTDFELFAVTVTEP